MSKKEIEQEKSKDEESTITVSVENHKGETFVSPPMTLQELKELPEKIVQLNLDGDVIKTLVVEDEETEVKTFIKMRYGDMVLRLSQNSYDNLTTQKKDENEEEHQNRMLRFIQGKIKPVTGEYLPIVKGTFDKGVAEIYARILKREGMN